MGVEYKNHVKRLHYSYTYIIERYHSVSNFISIILKRNSSLIISHGFNIENNTLLVTVELDSRECYKQILKHGYCELWLHDSENSYDKVEIRGEQLLQ